MRTIIIGNGGAAVESIIAMRNCGYEDEIHLFSDAIFPAFNPTLLTYFIAGKIGLESIFPYDGGLYDFYDVRLHLGSAVANLDAQQKTVESAAGGYMYYDNCVICSGASPVVPESYKDKEIYTIRSVQDAIALKKRISAGKRALVTGASMIGIKVAEALALHGLEVSLTDMQPHVFPLAAHANCAGLIERLLEERGIHLLLGTDSPDLSPYDIIVVCVGVRPNIGFIDKTQVDTDKGILVDQHMRTNADGLYAAGDCAQVRDGESAFVAPGLWPGARYMGRTAGANIAGRLEACFTVTRHNITRFFDVDFASVGDVFDGDDVFEWESSGKYCRIVWNGDRIAGINMLNMPEISGILKSQSLRSTELSATALGKVFGRYPPIKEAFAKRGLCPV